MTGVTHKFLIGVVAVRAVICVLLAHFVYQGKRIDLAIVYIGLEILIPTLVTLAYVQSGGPPPHALEILPDGSLQEVPEAPLPSRPEGLLGAGSLVAVSYWFLQLFCLGAAWRAEKLAGSNEVGSETNG